ncbi:hypothetical protein JOC37_001089 [Desulfohalotomaculum tongense]|uniref:hypothetical protein n=1 Tax=Desulforadius tongensis TaxID=1216062 RepID=UPI0019599D3A|nr:hypothetical protein [Desulforadius tongensis]MBM7854711.1 hypothetical protein [Desulforadius tongensis]
MELVPRPVTIFTGNLGSGKTEIAINFALNLLRQQQKVSLVDLDIINPYFRTRLARDCLAGAGLNVVCPTAELANADVPALSPAIRGALQVEDGYCVCDVGGDDVGAVALGRFKPYLPTGRFNFYFVVNACRPLTGTVEDIHKMLHSIEKSAHLKATALVNNTNLGAETDAQVVLNGEKVVRQAADKLGLPVAFTAARREIVPRLRKEGLHKILPLDFYMLPPWKRE